MVTALAPGRRGQRDPHTLRGPKGWALGLLLVASAACTGRADAPDQTVATPPPAAGTESGVPAPPAALDRPAPAAISEPDRTDYLAAAAARELRRYDEAVEGFARVHARGGPLASLAALRQAQSLVQAKRTVEAVPLFIAAARDTALPAQVRVTASLEGAVAAKEGGRTDDALALLASVGDPISATATETAQARWQTARILREQRDDGWGEQALRALAVAPASSHALAALDALDEARMPVDTLVAANVRYRARQNDKATQLYRSAAGAPASALDAARAAFYLGALAERAGRDGEAIEQYARASALAPAGPFAAEAHWWRGSLLARAGRTREAVDAFDAVSAGSPNSPWTGRALLEAALAANRTGAHDDAARRLRAIVATRPATEAATAAYWLGRLGLRTAGDSTPRTHNPYSFAALFDDIEAGAWATLPASAQREWNPAPGDWAAADAWLGARFGLPFPETYAAVGGPTMRFALAMVSVGERDAARPVLLALAASYRTRPHEAVALARAASASGFHDVGMVAAGYVLNALTPTERLEAPVALERLAYPVGYPEAVAAAAAAEGVPPLLLLALVRQESAFHVRAGSSAGAMGLTQVMPETGRLIASALQTEWRVDSLMRAETSLRFGAHYLGDQLRRFDGNVLAALAAYNAGPGAAARWLREARRADADGYLAAVDYEETRLYLQRVIEHYGHYRYVYGAADRPSIR